MQCENCLKVPLYWFSVVMPDNEKHWFCSWRCISEYAEASALDDQRLAEDVRRHVESLPPENTGATGVNRGQAE